MSSSIFLNVHQENFFYNIANLVQLGESRELSLTELINLTNQYRRLGISCLLLEDDVTGFSHYLNDEGYVFLNFVKNIPASELVLSKFRVIFDLIIIDNPVILSSVLAQCPDIFNSNYEYEDDFLYFFFLKSILLDESSDKLKKIIDDWKEVVNGAVDFRLSICNALLERDGELFDDAFHSLLSSWEESQQRILLEERDLPEVIETEGKVFMEGLGLLCIALARGMAVDFEYAYIPRSAISFTPPKYTDNRWKSVVSSD